MTILKTKTSDEFFFHEYASKLKPNHHIKCRYDVDDIKNDAFIDFFIFILDIFSSPTFKCNWTISYVPVHLAKGNGDALK